MLCGVIHTIMYTPSHGHCRPYVQTAQPKGRNLMRKLAVLAAFTLCLVFPAMAEPLERNDLRQIAHDTRDMLVDAVNRKVITNKDLADYMVDLGSVLANAARETHTSLDVAQAKETLDCIGKHLLAHNLRLPSSTMTLYAWIDEASRERHALGIDMSKIQKCAV